MFGSSKGAFARGRGAPGPRPLANLRVYHGRAAAGELAGIYVEPVIGGLRILGTNRVVVLVRTASEGVIHLFALDGTRGATHYLGEMPADQYRAFDDTAAGQGCVINGVRTLRLDRAAIASAIYAHPVWMDIDAGYENSQPLRLPETARTIHHSFTLHRALLRESQWEEGSAVEDTEAFSPQAS